MRIFKLVSVLLMVLFLASVLTPITAAPAANPYKITVNDKITVNQITLKVGETTTLFSSGKPLYVQDYLEINYICPNRYQIKALQVGTTKLTRFLGKIPIDIDVTIVP